MRHKSWRVAAIAGLLIAAGLAGVLLACGGNGWEPSEWRWREGANRSCGDRARGHRKKGEAARANAVPLTALSPSPDVARTAEASRAHAEIVEDGQDLPAALARAIEVATTERRQVLLNIRIAT